MPLSSTTKKTYANGTLVDSSTSNTPFPGSELAGKAMNYIKSNPKITAMLLAGGGAGLLGGGLSAAAPEREGEDTASRRMRILRNAVLSAGAGAGAVGLGMEGYNRLNEAVPANMPHPIAEKLNSTPARALSGAAGVGAGAAAGRSLGGKADDADEFIHALDIFKRKGVNKQQIDLLGSDAAKIQKAKSIAGAQGFNPTYSSPLTKMMDKVNNPHIRNALHTILGKTRVGQAARVGGAAGLFMPEIYSGAKDLLLED